jgi:uncharacterized iron-regulated membrane protein
MMREMNHKPHHKRHRRYSERNQILFLAWLMLVVVLALLGAILWWTNSPLHGSH